MKYLFEQSNNQPKQSDVDFAIKLILSIKIKDADSSHWAYIEYLCDLKGKNKPSQKAIDKVFEKTQAFRSKPELLHKLCTLDGNAASAKVIGETLVDYVRFHYSFETIKFFCEKATNKPTSSHVSEALSFALKNFPKNKEHIEYLCSLKGEMKLSPTNFNKVVDAALNEKDWVFVKNLCENNELCKKTIKHLLGKIVIGNSLLPFDLMTHVYQKSVTKPSQLDTSVALKTIRKKIEGFDSEHWQYINYLLTLTGDNKPEQDDVNKVLIKAFSFSNENLLKNVVFQKENAPSEELVSELLLSCINDAKNLKSLAFISNFYELSINKPTTAHISEALIALLKNFPKEKDYINYFCSFNLKQTAINNLLESSVAVEDWDMAKALFERSIAPDQEAVSTVILALTSEDGTYFNFQACEFLVYLSNLRGTNKPNQNALKAAALWATTANDLDFVKDLFSKIEDKVIVQEIIDKSLPTIASSFHSLPMLRYLCELEGIKLDQKVIDKAFVNSVDSKSLEVVQYLNSLSTKPSEQAIKQASAKAEKLGDLVLSIVNFLKSLVSQFVKKEEKVEIKSTTPIREVVDQRRVSEKERENTYPSQKGQASKGGIFEPEASCFTGKQRKDIKARITLLRKDLKESCCGFFTGPKPEKINGLEKLLKIGKEPGMTVARAIRLIDQDKRYPNLRAGVFSNETDKLLKDLLKPEQKTSTKIVS
ncbi:MAG: hypothetical protein H0U73_06730 [Tatlockia sp.]|nr:hypothetical protein [Tatlockia sp.]